MSAQTIAVVMSGSALAVSVVSLRLERRSRARADALHTHQAVEGVRARLVIEEHQLRYSNGLCSIDLVVLNTGPAPALDVDAMILSDIQDKALLLCEAEAEVARAMMAGDRSRASLTVPSALKHERDVYVHLNWVDGDGAHDERNIILLRGDASSGILVSDWSVGHESWSRVP